MILLSSLAFAGNSVHVRDLDPMEAQSLEIDEQGRLWSDGVKVRGSRMRKLEYLGEVMGDDNPTLRLDERRAALRRMNAVAALLPASSAVLTAVSVAAPPLGLPLLAGKLAIDGVGLAVGHRAVRAYDARGLAEAVNHHGAMADAGVELP